MTSTTVSQPRHHRNSGAALSDCERYAAVECWIAERLRRKARGDRAVAEAIERARRQFDHVIDAARWRSASDLRHLAESMGYPALADWFARGAPGGDYPAWCAGECRTAFAERIDPVGLSTRSADIEIEQGRLDPSARQAAIDYNALCMANRYLGAAAYLKQLRQRRQNAVRVHRGPTRRLHCARRSTHRTVRSRRTRITARPAGDSGDGDGEPPRRRRPRARGPPSRVGRIASGTARGTETTPCSRVRWDVPTSSINRAWPQRGASVNAARRR